MSGGFSNPLVGGGGGLVYPSIHSPNYLPTIQGWSINKDGSAQFAGALSVLNGVISGVAIEALTETLSPGPFLLYGSTGQGIAVFTTPGSNNWVAPAGLVGSLIDTVIVTGAGGGGDGLDAGAGESGAGGGACSVMNNVAVTIGNTYHPFVGTGGPVNVDGTASTFAGDAVTVTGNPGKGAVDPTVNPPGGAASTLPAGVSSLAGGPGGGSGGAPHGGGGGGGAASSNQAGNPGQAGTSTAGGLGGARALAYASGGAGGAGGAPGGAATAGSTPGGGGGGGGSGSGAGAAGANGQVVLLYRISAATPLIASMAAAAGTDPNTGTGYQRGITTYDPVFGDSLSIFGATLAVSGAPLKIVGAALDVVTAGQGLRVAEGANAKQGIATLVAGSVVVADTAVTANSRIAPLYVTPSANAGAIFFTAITPGVGFTIKSTNAADTSVVGYQIFEPG